MAKLNQRLGALVEAALCKNETACVRLFEARARAPPSVRSCSGTQVDTCRRGR
jgi:hypothetical protein